MNRAAALQFFSGAAVGNGKAPTPDQGSDAGSDAFARAFARAGAQGGTPPGPDHEPAPAPPASSADIALTLICKGASKERAEPR